MMDLLAESLTDHPRSRGEYEVLARRRVRRGGSSPLSRGIPGRGPAAPGGGRIIPALAGNTTAHRRTARQTRDHPRSRGEYPGSRCRSRTAPGSSPLSRGILRRTRRSQGRRRIIPALAGNTARATRQLQSRSDHPRSRGEYRSVTCAASTATGSSPLSRGIRPALPWRSVRGRIIPALAGNTGATPDSLSLYRIIPALAGNTLRAGLSSRPYADHPRSRGEYREHVHHASHNTGSSPLSRGIRDRHIVTGLDVRIIPALAGNTSASRRAVASTRDHPRSRGEYVPRSDSASVIGGSSPLSRGILEHHQQGFPGPRIIPALAGNTRCVTPDCLSRSDHPRSRGEYRGDWRDQDTVFGSSPLSRGILWRRLPRRHRLRIIPALAGNTRTGAL